jgi:hypothetical protein
MRPTWSARSPGGSRLNGSRSSKIRTMSHALSQPNLRLVGGVDDAVTWRSESNATRAVMQENRVAAHAPAPPRLSGLAEMSAGMSTLDPGDPRWALAMQTQARLQGATLTPEHREQLLKCGRKLGLRPFEANLVIAIMQDQARCAAKALKPQPGAQVIERAEPAQTSPPTAEWPRWVAAAASAAVLAALLIYWLAG